MRPDETWLLTPREIVTYAKAMATLQSEKSAHALRLEWLNAALQRAKKMPKFEELTRTGERKPTLAQIAKRFDLKPSGKKKE